MISRNLIAALCILSVASGVVILLSTGHGSAIVHHLKDLTISGADYPEGLLELNDSSLDEMLDEYPIIVINGYYPGCGSCKAANSTLFELSRDLKSQAAFGLMNVKKNNVSRKRYNITSYPTILIFKNGVLASKQKGARSKQDLLGDLQKIEPSLNLGPINGTAQAKAPSSGKPLKASDLPQEISLSKMGEMNPSAPMQITDNNINLAIHKYPLLVLEGFSYDCEHCHRMNATLLELSEELRGQVAFGLINAKENTETKKRYNITAYPTLLIFRNGSLVASQKGERSKSDFVKTLKRLKPALDTSDVKPGKLQPSGSAIKQTGLSQAPSLPTEIPMIKLGSSNPSAPMLTADENLQYALDKYPIFVLEGFASWCGYCRKMNGTFSELSGDLQGQAAFGLINAEKNNETKKEYNISAYPTILIFKNGKLVDSQSGYSTSWDLASRLKRLDPSLNISKVKPSSKQNVARTNSPPAPKKNCSDIKKEDLPQLQAFVVSYCPFGLQMQRILSEIIEKIPASSKNIKVRYIGDVSEDKIGSMHGQQEADENLVQICIREEQSDRYWKYVTCFAKSGSSDDCLNSSEIDGGMLKECTMQRNRGIKYAEQDFEIARKFGANGSPTIILNNETVSEFDFGGRTDEAVKTLLCCSFASKPNFCSQNLNTSKVATGFSMRKRAKPDLQPPTAKAA